MKTTSMIALIAVISTISIGIISMNGFSAIPLVTASVNPESGMFMGHVEYILRDSDNNIKSYIQSDNMVVDKGDDCVVAYTFQKGETADQCTPQTNGFRYIGIGNGTITVDNNDTTLVDGGGTGVGTAGAGLLATRFDSNTDQATSSENQAIVVIQTESPFTFTAGVNNTTILNAGLFDAPCTANAQGQCTALASPMNMFSAQVLPNSGVAVAGGDSLSVTWTITVGNGS